MVTTATKDTEMEELLGEIQDAEKAPEPGSMTMREILHRGDEGLPAAVVAGAMNSAGWVFIYNTLTHERHRCNRNMLNDALTNKRRPDGSRIFTTSKPSQKPVLGQMKCMLHPEGPNRKRYDEMGLPVCESGHLQNGFELRRHMQNRHKSSWEAIREEEAREKDSIELDFKRMLLEQAGRKATQI